MKVLNKFRFPVGTRRKTGERCPENGLWRVVGNRQTTAQLRRGQSIPEFFGIEVTWMLVEYR